MDDARVKDMHAIISVLQEHGVKTNGRRVRCPFHDDRHASAGVFQSTVSGDWLFGCRTCRIACDVWGLEARLSGTTRKELLNSSGGYLKVESSAPEPVAYDTLADLEASLSNVQMKFYYTDPESEHVDLAVYRLPTPDGGKRFLQAHCNGRGWVLKKPKGRLPLYNRKRVLAADQVVVVEGEKAVHALFAAGVVGTTNSGGANNGSSTDWSPLSGKDVVLWPDNDEAGQTHMEFVRGVLERLDPPASVSMVDVSSVGLAAKGDAWDMVMSPQGTPYPDVASKVQQVLAGAKPLNPSTGVLSRIKAIASGEMQNISWPWPMLTEYTQALLPSTVTLVCGEPGAGKSFWLLQALHHWHVNSVPVACMELEEDRDYYLHRLLAQISGEHGMLSVEWMQYNHALAEQHYVNHRKELDSFGRVIWERGRKQYTLDELAVWAEERAKDGARVIAIDPITVAETSAQRFIDDAKFTSAIEHVIKTYRTSVVLVTHPSRGSTVKNGILAGSEAYPRTARTILWLHKHQGDPMEVKDKVGLKQKDVPVNLLVSILKARNGPMPKTRLAYEYSSHMTFTEKGEVIQ